MLKSLFQIIRSCSNICLHLHSFGHLEVDCKRSKYHLIWCLLYIYIYACYIYIGTAPEYLMELCRPVSSAAGRQSLRSASKGDLIIPRFKLRTFGFPAFAISGPQLWNSLPLDVRQSRDNLMQFKMKLKTFLFQQFWALLWIQSNEGPYKCSILLLLLLLWLEVA